MNLLQIYRDARALIEKGWTQWQYARTADGRVCDHNGEDAACWCATGALYRAGAGKGFSAQQLKQPLLEATEAASVADWNDAPGRTQAEVLAAFDRAIANLELAAAQPG